MGGFAGAAGGAVGGKFGNLLKNFNFSFNGYTSPFIDGAIKGAISGSAGGFVGGGIGAAIYGQNIWDGAVNGAISGLKIGGAAGGSISAYNAARASGNFWDAFAYKNSAYSSRYALNQGRIGEGRLVEYIEKAGGEILGEQVTVEIGCVRTRVDVVAEINGEVVFFEAKNGTYARLTQNQSAAYNNFENGASAVAKGMNASNAGYSPGSTIPVNRIEIYHYKPHTGVQIQIVYPINR